MNFFLNFKKTLNLLEDKEKTKFFILSFFTLFITLFELISLGSIPIYISIIFDPSLLSNYLIKFNLDEFAMLVALDNFIYYASFFLIFAFLIKNIFIAGFHFLNIKFINDLVVRIGNQIYHNNIHSDYLYHINRSTAELIRNHVEVRRFAGLVGHYQRILLEGFLLLFLLIITLKLFFEITILFFVLFSIFFLIYFFTIKKWANTAGKKIQKYRKIENILIDNSFSGIKEIKFNLQEKYFSHLFNTNYFKLNRNILLQNLVAKVPKISLEMLAVILITFISIYFFTSNETSASKITNLSFLSVVAIRLIPAFNAISVATSSIKYTEPSIDIVEKDLKNITYHSLKNKKNKIIKHYQNKVKHIKVENVSFEYDQDGGTIFHDLNFEINENDKIGFTGKSGSGKTTLINLLTGLISPTKGKIFFNEVNIHNNTNLFYNKISYVTQDPILFNDTIQNNITFNNNEVDKIKLNKILEICRLDDFIKNTSLGLNAIVGEKGLKISGGQIQRIGIARALYKDFDILILDEATSALSKEYEKNILDTIFKLYNDKIIIIISHNIDNFSYCKKILNIKEHHINISES